MAESQETRQCAHEPCVCTTPPGQAYCSEYCEHTATSGPPREEPVCACGHLDCRSR